VTRGPSVPAGQLRADLARLGLPTGGTVLVQVSMRRIGWLDGGADALLDALRDAIGPDGTVVTPTQTANNSTTTREFREAARGLSAAGRQALEDAIAGYEPAHSVSYRMGRFAEAVRTSPGAVRSGHPQTSFSAVGPDAQWLMAVHDQDSHLGERSPLARLYDEELRKILVVPRQHIASLNDLTPAHDQIVGEVVRRAAALAAERHIAVGGFRTVFNTNRDAGQTVFHIHLHLIGGRSLGWPPG